MRPPRAGATLTALAERLLTEGAWIGDNLDGGGPTTTVIGGRVVNAPSDGPERRRTDGLLMVPRP